MFHKVNDPLLHVEAAGDLNDNYKAWTAVESFDSYTQSIGTGEFKDNSFYFETFNDQGDSTNANAFALEKYMLDPSISLVYNVLGRVVFDSSCSNDYLVAGDDGLGADDDDGDDDDDDTCETVGTYYYYNMFDLELFCCCFIQQRSRIIRLSLISIY